MKNRGRATVGDWGRKWDIGLLLELFWRSERAMLVHVGRRCMLSAFDV